MMRLLRGLASLALLVSLLAGVPALLWRATQTIDWARLVRLSLLLSPDDGTTLLAVMTAVGWGAWVVFTACVVSETVTLLSRRRIQIRMPGLAGPQSWVAGLLISVAAMVAGPLSPSAQAASIPAAHVVTAHPERVIQPDVPSVGVVSSAPDENRVTPPGSSGSQGTSPGVTHDAVAPGIGGLLAAALVSLVAAERARQLAGRQPGRRIRHPEGAARTLERGLRQRQDEPAMRRLHLAFGVLAAHLRRRGAPAPPLAHIVVAADHIEFRFLRRPGTAPPGFLATERSWILPAEELLQWPPCPMYPWPAVVPIGVTDRGEEILVDLEARGVTGIDDAGPRGSEAVHALVLELCSVPWGSDTEVVVVGGDETFVRGLAQPQVRAESSIEAALRHFERIRHERERANVAHRRLDPAAGDAWRVHVLVIAAPLDADQHRRLNALGAGPESGLAVVCASSEIGCALRLESRGVWTGDGLPEATGSVTGQAIGRSTRAALGDLHGVVSDPRTTVAPWWDGRVASPGHGSPPVLARDGPAPPQVLLLGPVDLVGATGTPPARAIRQCIEYAAWLLEHPGTTAPAMADALIVAEGTRRSNMSRLRTWLGRDPRGEPYLPEAYSGRIRLHPDVSSDWQQLTLLTVAGVNRAHEQALIAALELVRGAPLADAAPTQWHWAEELRTDISSMVRDIGAVLTERALDRNDIDLARWAAARALTAAPEDELLLCARVRTEYQAGNPDEVRRLALRLTRHARTLNIDLADQTVMLLQQVMEGRLRPRSVATSHHPNPTRLDAP